MTNLQTLARRGQSGDDSLRELGSLIGLMNAMNSPIREDERYTNELALRQDAQRIQQEQFAVNTGLAEDRIAASADEQDEAAMRWEAEFGLRKLADEQDRIMKIEEQQAIQQRAEMANLLGLAQLGMGGAFGEKRPVNMGILGDAISEMNPGLAGFFQSNQQAPASSRAALARNPEDVALANIIDNQFVAPEQ